jgi:hypothetical protein
VSERAATVRAAQAMGGLLRAMGGLRQAMAQLKTRAMAVPLLRAFALLKFPASPTESPAELLKRQTRVELLQTAGGVYRGRRTPALPPFASAPST